MQLCKLLYCLTMALFLSSCHQPQQDHENKYEANERIMKIASTPLEEILESSTIYGGNDFNDDEANLLFNKRACEIVDNLADLDHFNPLFTAQNCKIGYQSEYYIKISSFVSHLGKMPYVEVGRAQTEAIGKTTNLSIAMLLVGTPNNSIWEGATGDLTSFIKDALSEYDVIYIPAFYGTVSRSKAVGPILAAGAEELDLFLDFIALKNSGQVDVLSASGGGLLSALLRSKKVQRVIMINPPLASMKQIYHHRQVLYFHGSKRDKKLKMGSRVGLGDIITLEKENSRFYGEIGADYLVRYFGSLFDVALVNYVDSDDYNYQNCSYILIGSEDETMGREFFDLDKMSTPFKMLNGVNHIFIDTTRERGTVIKAIRDIRRKDELCGT